ncbi:membrane protein insertase YidC [Alteromonas sp. 14N.309.X.WAT.G.H12]|uniref:membrane protein insertase YidC n=1 Tax=Alteromonas sp. 14N.309.X.WAT.G.H12 TaxID=3120824 RepID=UPI002FD5065F
MESQRSFLLIGLALVSFLLWQQWQQDYGPQPVQPEVSEQATVSTTDNGVPSAQQQSLDVPSDMQADVPNISPNMNESAVNQNGNRYVHVLTDTLDLQIDLVGGDVVKANLVKFPLTLESSENYSLLRPNDGLYIAQSGLVGQDGPDGNRAGRPRYTATSKDFVMDGDSLSVPLTWQNADGLKITKTFNFTKGNHDVVLTYAIENGTANATQFLQYAQLKQTTDVPDRKNMFMPTYRGAAFGSEEDRYQKYTFDDIEDKSLKISTEAGWVGMLEHYFVAAWIPPQEQENTLYTKLIQNQYAIIGFTGKPVTVASGETASISSELYLGPKDQDNLAKLANGLDLTVDYGILWWISQPLFALLQFIHSIVGNWGLAIILITVIVKGAMFPLTKKQYESMARMRNLAPKMQQLKDRFGDDRQKMSQAMMELYRKEKVNPMGGCLPIILQMPIFLALYWVLLESVELRHADFFLWITDLSVKDPYFVLPVLTGASMWLLQKLQPTTVTDPMQQKIMQFMPVAMSIFFLWFPAGLVLYWLVSNIITLVQAKLIYAAMEKKGLKSK